MVRTPKRKQKGNPMQEESSKEIEVDPGLEGWCKRNYLQEILPNLVQWGCYSLPNLVQLLKDNGVEKVRMTIEQQNRYPIPDAQLQLFDHYANQLLDEHSERKSEKKSQEEEEEKKKKKYGEGPHQHFETTLPLLRLPSPREQQADEFEAHGEWWATDGFAPQTWENTNEGYLFLFWSFPPKLSSNWDTNFVVGTDSVTLNIEYPNICKAELAQAKAAFGDSLPPGAAEVLAHYKRHHFKAVYRNSHYLFTGEVTQFQTPYHLIQRLKIVPRHSYSSQPIVDPQQLWTDIIQIQREELEEIERGRVIKGLPKELEAPRSSPPPTPPSR